MGGKSGRCSAADTEEGQSFKRSGLSVPISVGISIRMKTEKCSLDVAKRLALTGVIQWHEGHRREERADARTEDEGLKYLGVYYAPTG